MTHLKGIYTALVTPFKTISGKSVIDWESYYKLLDFQLENKIHGLVVFGTTGESPTLTHDEKLELVKKTKEYIKGRLPIIVGGPGNNTEESFSFIQCVKELGVDGVLAVTPYYNKPTQAGILEHYKYLAKAGVPLILYNVGSRTVVEANLETLKKLKNVPNIVGLKQATDSIVLTSEICNALSDSWSILAGDDTSLSYTLLAGGHGAISGPACVMPKEMVAIYEEANLGNYKKSSEIQLMNLDKIKSLFIETNPCPVKTALSIKGIIASDEVRLPLVPTSAELKNRLKELF